MTKNEFKNEKLYTATMALAGKLLSEGKVSKEAYREFDTRMRQKYRPKFGNLTARERLI